MTSDKYKWRDFKDPNKAFLFPSTRDQIIDRRPCWWRQHQPKRHLHPCALRAVHRGKCLVSTEGEQEFLEGFLRIATVATPPQDEWLDREEAPRLRRDTERHGEAWSPAVPGSGGVTSLTSGRLALLTCKMGALFHTSWGCCDNEMRGCTEHLAQVHGDDWRCLRPSCPLSSKFHSTPSPAYLILRDSR